MLFPAPSDPALDRAPRTASELGIRKPVQQIAAVIAIATIVVWLSRYPVSENRVAPVWFGSSIAISVFFNKGAERLLFAPVLAVMIFPTALANEVAAHLIFGTCIFPS